MNTFERITEWNIERELAEFSLRREVKMLAEELFEMCGMDRENAKQASEVFVRNNVDTDAPVDLDAVIDAAGDLIFIATGTIMKAAKQAGVDITPHQVMEKICDHNDKKGSKKDADGKIIKDVNFVEPTHLGNN